MKLFANDATEMNALDLSFAELNISENSTRSSAKRSVMKNDIHCCIVCLKRFESHKLLRKHVSKTHRADRNEVKHEFQKCKEALEDGEANATKLYNYKLALLKHSFLERFSSR